LKNIKLGEKRTNLPIFYFFSFNVWLFIRLQTVIIVCNWLIVGGHFGISTRSLLGTSWMQAKRKEIKYE